jgi:hypothetical protein
MAGYIRDAQTPPMIAPQPLRPFLSTAACLALVAGTHAQPYAGTIFIDADIINDTDPGTLVSVTYTGQGMQTMWDYSVPGWVTVNAYLFDVVWNDGLTCTAMVNPSFGSVAAAQVEADKYAAATGKIPSCLRTGVDALWIHGGVFSFGGGNNAITIHTGRGEEYITDGILEEALVHEGVHCSLSALYDSDTDWLAAAAADPGFISTYAQSYPATEDLSETYLTWLAVRYRASRISTADYNTILSTVPARLAFLDSMACDLYPITSGVGIVGSKPGSAFTVYPSPANDRITIATGHLLPGGARLELYTADGRLVRSVVLVGTTTIEVADLAPGVHCWRVVSGEVAIEQGMLAIER